MALMTLTRIITDRHFQQPAEARVHRLIFEELSNSPPAPTGAQVVLLLTNAEAVQYELGQEYDVAPTLAQQLGLELEH